MNYRIENIGIRAESTETKTPIRISFEVTKEGKKVGTCEIDMDNIPSLVELGDEGEKNKFVFRPANRPPKKNRKCEHCGKVLGTPYRLRVHIDVVHKGLKPFQCNVCGKSFGRKCGLAQHKVSHSAIKPHVCTECGKSFLHLSRLKSHIDITHRGLEPFKCQECGKSYSQKNDLKLHIQRVHRGIGFQCKECGSEFQRKCEYDKHRKSHEEHQQVLQVFQEQAAATANIQEEDDEEWISGSDEEESEEEYSTIDNNWDKIMG